MLGKLLTTREETYHAYWKRDSGTRPQRRGPRDGSSASASGCRVGRGSENRSGT
jgi:hypothetical protein